MVSSNHSMSLIVIRECVKFSLERFLRSWKLKKVYFLIFVLEDNRVPKVLLWRTLKLVCFSSDSDDFEFTKKFYTHFPTITSNDVE